MYAIRSYYEGLDVQCHTQSHRNLNKIIKGETLSDYVDAVENELASCPQIIEKNTWETFSEPHLPDAGKEAGDPYFTELKEEGPPGMQSFTMLEFLGTVRPRNLMPVHYSGAEDLKHHGSYNFV